MQGYGPTGTQLLALSMTGFGSAEGAVGSRRARVEIRTVNHRWFNLSARLPGDMASVETELRDALRREFDRGHLTVHVSWSDDATHHLLVDYERAGAAVTALRELQERFNLDGGVTVEMVARQPEVFGAQRVSGPVSWQEVAPVVAAAATECRAARQREGDALAAEIVGRLDALLSGADNVARLAPARLEREHARLSESVRHLLGGVAADPQRIAQEIALHADRLDVTEELVRFRAHVDAARAIVAGDQPVGKQLGFLAQEIGREVNTMGSKANDASIAHEVVRMKGELEKIREQLENLE